MNAGLLPLGDRIETMLALTQLAKRPGLKGALAEQGTACAADMAREVFGEILNVSGERDKWQTRRT